MPDFPNQPDPTLPATLQRDLTALHHPATSVPPDLDAEILAAARARLDRAHRPVVLFRFSRLAAGLTAAAAVAIVAIFAWPTRHPMGGATPAPIALRKTESVENKKLAGLEALADALTGSPAFTPGDVNSDGRIDILDALAVARAIDAGSVPTDLAARAEMTGDGQLDQRDIDAIALLAVSLTPVGPGGADAHKLKGGGS